MAASSTPIVSVVMPIYNGARYLHAALRSILDQTLRDIELIAIDDASVDGTSEILASAARMDTRMRVIQN
ncbi:MAG TPA: glycosyltransferase, partial [Candidatus Solibacter sp.]|nr:glycosyltransferase [Candidatus Solibacter sp.]